MAVALSPSPNSLGFGGPVLGPWFSTDVTLPVPDNDLSVSIASLSSDWQPPARGIISLYVATSPIPHALAPLRKADGTAPFAANAVVGLFQLLTEVEERLNALQTAIPSASGAGVRTVPTRARVRYLALELPSSTSVSDLGKMLGVPSGTSDADILTTIGLTQKAGQLANGDAPMRSLLAPGALSSAPLLHFTTGTAVKLWAFDSGGRAIDPGAVAAWWNFLATVAFNNLWAEGVGSGSQRTATVSNQLSLHLVNAHEGPLSPPLMNRLNVTGATGTGPVRVRTGAVAINFSSGPTPPTPDDAPVARAALLPDGTYAATVSVWPSGPVHPSLSRDQVRIAVLDVEEHLVGQKRTAGSSASPSATRRANLQNEASTRTPVSATTVPTLLSTNDATASAAIGVLRAGGAVDLVASVLSRDWGGLNFDASTLPAVAPATPPDATNPTQPPTYQVHALTGGGTDNAGTVTGQRVQIELTFDHRLSGAWIRAWPQGFDSSTGLHFKLDGGAGVVRSDGTASLVMQLADGASSPGGPLGFDLLLLTANGLRLYQDLRFNRPAPVGGTPITIGAATGPIVICETGTAITTVPPGAGTIPSGASVFSRETAGGGNPALIDMTTLPASAFSSGTLIVALPSGARVQLTQPAFRNTPDGDSTTLLAANAATVHRFQRQGLTVVAGAGTPLPTMERLEVGASAVGANSANGAVAAAPALGRYHELLPHQSGHPGAPAAIEVHAAGASLNGPAAIQLAEYLRDRTSGDSITLADRAFNQPFPNLPDPASPHAWAAILRTVAAEVEMEVGVAQLVDPGGFTFGQTLSQIRNALQGITSILPGTTINDLANEALSAARALDRRVAAAAYGGREAAISLLAAIQRAEDLVYIETPAFDGLTFGHDNDTTAVWNALVSRLDERPALNVLICFPVRSMPGFPDALGNVRDKALLDALATVSADGAGGLRHRDRIAVFAPAAGPGRTLRLASTTVVIDDVYALTGTTHLWRRGLSFDSSLAVAVFDEQLDAGRPREVRSFRRALLAGRLGLSVNLVPDDPADLIEAVKTLSQRGGIGRLATTTVRVPTAVPSATDIDIWDVDGSRQSGASISTWLLALLAGASNIAQDLNPAP